VETLEVELLVIVTANSLLITKVASLRFTSEILNLGKTEYNEPLFAALPLFEPPLVCVSSIQRSFTFKVVEGNPPSTSPLTVVIPEILI